MTSTTTRSSRFFALGTVLAIYVIIRVPFLRHPLADHFAHRQTDTASIARNFAERRMNILWPQIDWGNPGEPPGGYVESEFPLLPFLAACVYRTWTHDDRIGRVISLAFATAACGFLWALLRRRIGLECATWGSLFLAVAPLDIFYSRCFMPEASTICFSIAGLYFFDRWIGAESVRDYLAATACVALALLTKLTSAYIGFVLLFMVCERWGLRFVRRREVWGFALLSLMPPALYYAHAHSIYRTYGLTFGILAGGYSKFGTLALWTSPRFYAKIGGNVATIVLTPLGLALAAGGAMLAWRNRVAGARLVLVWVASFLLFILVVAEGNQAHDYYQLPLAHAVAGLAGITLASMRRLLNRWCTELTPMPIVRAVPYGLCGYVLVQMLVVGLNMTHTFYVVEWPLLEMAKALRQCTAAGDLVVTADASPRALYHAHRRGWSIHKAGAQQMIRQIQPMRAQGATVLALPLAYDGSDVRLLETLAARFPPVNVTRAYAILDLGRR